MMRPLRLVPFLLLVLLLGASAARAQGVEQLQDRELARRRFDEGLMFVDRRDFARALAAFEEAYRLQPHPTVLYNIGQAYQALDRPAEAAEHLQRYLDQVGELPAERRAAVEEQIRRLKLMIAPTPPPLPAPKPAPAAVVTTPPPPAPPARLAPALVAGGGVALVAGAVGLRLWNDGRYRSWQRQSAILGQRPEPGSAAEADAIDAERAGSNARLDQIRRTDTVAWALGAAGVAVVVGGALWWWSLRPGRPGQRAAAEHSAAGW